jgi:hypothetical protein
MNLRMDCGAVRQCGSVRQCERQYGRAHGGSVRQCAWLCIAVRAVVCGCPAERQCAVVCGSAYAYLCATVRAAVCGSV